MWCIDTFSTTPDGTPFGDGSVLQIVDGKKSLSYIWNNMEDSLLNTEAINDAIRGTQLESILTAEDLERWRKMDRAGADKAPLWLSVLISMAASLNMEPSEVDNILQAAKPLNADRSTLSGVTLHTIDPTFIVEMSLSADAALRRGNAEESETLWLKTLQTALDERITIAEPYRLFANVASAAYLNGSLLLGEAALNIALNLNPQYSFGQKLQEQALRGDFLQYSLRKLANNPRFDFVSSKDLETTSTEQILKKLAKMGIELDEIEFKAIGRSVRDTIETIVDNVKARASDAREVDDDYLYAACEVLWDRLITRPLMETFMSIVFDLEDVEPGSSLYFSTIERLAWAFEQADKAVFETYQKYPHDFASLRATVHDLLAYEVLRQSNVAEHMLAIGEAGLASGFFPDFAVADVIRRIAAGKNWQYQLEQLLKHYPEHSQMMAMGIARGLLETGEDYKAIGVGRTVWDRVLAGELEPDEWPLQCLEDYILAAYENLGDKRSYRQAQKEAEQIDRSLESRRLSDAKEQRKASQKPKEDLLRQENKYPELFAYEDFVLSLGLDFSTQEPTNDKLSAFSLQTGEKIGRNEPCPCGSGKKYKKCHGAMV